MIPAILLFAMTGTISTSTAPSEHVPEAAPNHYCGILCVYAAAHVVGHAADFEELVDGRFLSGTQGSTVGDLERALAHVGIPCRASGALSLGTLRRLERPAILHVRTPSAGATYGHWVLFLGFDAKGQVKLFDPPRDEGSMEASEFLSIWDGVGILLERESFLSGALDLLTVVNLGILAVLVVAIFLGARRFRPELAILGPALAASVLGHALTPEGFLRAPTATRRTQAAYFPPRPNDLEFIELEDAQRLSQSSGHEFIDARTSAAFRRFHLPGARNIPIDSSTMRLNDLIASLPSDKRFIVYCQSEGCGWAETMAGQLIVRGIKPVMVFRGGVHQWQQSANASGDSSP